jgi:hypothetical protein
MSQKEDNKEPKLGAGSTVAAGTIIVAGIGLITAFFNQGSLELLQGMGKAVAQQPSSSISSNPSPNTPSSNSSFQVNVQDFVVKLQGCKRINETVKCEFFVTNNKEDRGLHLYNNLSRIIDFKGNEYRPSNFEFGGKNSRTEGGTIVQNLVQGVGLKAIFTFEKVPLQVNKLALIQLESWTSSGGYLSFKLRDIPVSN